MVCVCHLSFIERELSVDIRHSLSLISWSADIYCAVGEPSMMASDNDQLKTFEKDVIAFSGYDEKVSFTEIDEYMARYMRMRFGRQIGEGLWNDTLPVIEGVVSRF